VPLLGPTHPQKTHGGAAPIPVRVTTLAGERLQLDFESAPLRVDLEALPLEDVRALLADFLECVNTPSQFSVVPTAASSMHAPARWEAKLRAEFLARYGPGLLPLPDSLERSPLFMALRLSPRYMGAGIRDAARELFRSPIFLASVTLSILVYFSAWVLPEPLFSKAFAATLSGWDHGHRASNVSLPRRGCTSMIERTAFIFRITMGHTLRGITRRYTGGLKQRWKTVEPSLGASRS